MRCSRFLDHRVSDPALLAQPVLAVPVKLGDAVVGEELRSRPRRRGFLCDRLGAVFTELGRVPLARIRVRPGTTHAIEAVDLIEVAQGTRGPPRPHVLHRAFQGHSHTGNPSRTVVRLGYVNLGLVVLLGPAHGSSIAAVRVASSVNLAAGTQSCFCSCSRIALF